jgi:tetratricopeptide (TPR) repeat protein
MRRLKRVAVLPLAIMLTFICVELYSQSEGAAALLQKSQESVIAFTTFGPDKERIATGSGFFIGEGLAVTSYHLVSKASSVEGRNFKGKKVKVEGIMGVDRKLNIALLKVKSKSPALPLGNSDELGMGNTIFAIGGNESGQIRAFDGEIREIMEYAPNQRVFDASLVVSESFCGGPILDSEGMVMGLTAFLDDGSKYVLPSNLLKNIPKRGTATEFKSWKSEDYFTTLDGAYLAGRIYFSLARSSKAEKALREVVKLMPNELDAHIILAAVYSDQRDFSRSVETYNKIIELRPALDSAHLGLGSVYLKMRKWSEAIQPLKKAIELNNENKEAYFQIGNAYEELREFGSAAEAYKKYLTTNPENQADVYVRLAQCQMESEQFGEAIVSYQESLKTKQDSDIQYKLGQAYQKAGQLDNAAGIYKTLAKSTPEDAKIYYNTIVMMYDEAQMPDKAAEAASLLVELEPDNTDALYNLGYMHLKSNKYEEAISAFRKVIELRPEMEYAYTSIGYVYQQMKNYRGSIDIYKELVKIYPDNFTGWISIGMGYMHLKQFTTALEPLKKAIELKPDDATSYYNLAICYLNLREDLKARETYLKLKTIDAAMAQKLLQYFR